MSTKFEVSFSDPTVQSIIRAAFPGATSRRPVQINSAERYQVSNYWSEGSRDYSAFVKLETLEAVSSEALPIECRQQVNNPFQLAIGEVVLIPGIAVVENCIFRGKDLGYRIFLHPANFAPLLPSAPVIDSRDQQLLNVMRTYKAGPYRQAELANLKYNEDDKVRLEAGGYIKVAKNGAVSLTEKGRIAAR